jgi:hypothetical protein
MEPIRPKVDRLLFQWISNQIFSPKDFFETREGICRVSQGIIGEIIPLIKSLDSSINNVIRLYAKYFKDKSVIHKPVEFCQQESPCMPSETNNVETEPTANKKTIIFAEIGNRDKRVCPECGLDFMPMRVDQNFCCPEHSRSYNRRISRAKWKADGKCQMCGKQMPEGWKGIYKEKVTYCSDCAARMKRYYKEKRIIAYYLKRKITS